MTLTPQFLDELRARTSLSGLIAHSVKLQKAGREFKACCPFHHEKTPSFTVNDEKHFYHCFGCGAHGDAIRFLTDARGLQFMDAVKELADAAGLELPAPDPQSREKAERQAGLHDVMSAAAEWFREQLGGLEGAEARSYLQKRGIIAKAQGEFAIGYAPDSRGKLKDALRRFGKEALIEAGLLIQPEGDRDPYDRFRGRLMIPIRDPRGRVIAFGGRIIGAGEPKYLNSPDTPLFDKGRTLYNLDRAAAASRASNRMIVVEGYLDVIALDQVGIGEAVAPLGTALTEGQLELLWRRVGTPLLCFDGDSAGQRAGDRAMLRALPMAGPDRSLAFVTLPPGQDPDDLVRAGGRAGVEVPLSAPEPLVDRLWRSELNAEPLATPESKAGLRRRLLERADTVADNDVRDQYRAELMRRFSDFTRPPRREFTPSFQPGPRRFPGGGRFQPPPRPTTEAAKTLGATGLSPALGRAVLTGLLHFPEVIAGHTQAIATLPIAAGGLQILRDLMLEAAFAHESLDRDSLLTILADNGAAALAEALRRGRGLSFSFTRASTDPERAQRDLVLVVDTLAARPELDAAYRAATDRLKEASDPALFEEQKRLRTELEEMDRRLSRLVLDGETG